MERDYIFSDDEYCGSYYSLSEEDISYYSLSEEDISYIEPPKEVNVFKLKEEIEELKNKLEKQQEFIEELKNWLIYSADCKDWKENVFNKAEESWQNNNINIEKEKKINKK